MTFRTDCNASSLLFVFIFTFLFIIIIFFFPSSSTLVSWTRCWSQHIWQGDAWRWYRPAGVPVNAAPLDITIWLLRYVAPIVVIIKPATWMHALTVTKARRRVAECYFRFCYLLRASAAKGLQADLGVKIFVDFLYDFLPKKVRSCILDLVNFVGPALATYPTSVTFSYCKTVAWEITEWYKFFIWVSQKGTDICQPVGLKPLRYFCELMRFEWPSHQAR